jgi:hypothetical protein
VHLKPKGSFPAVSRAEAFSFRVLSRLRARKIAITPRLRMATGGELVLPRQDVPLC